MTKQKKNQVSELILRLREKMLASKVVGLSEMPENKSPLSDWLALYDVAAASGRMAA